MVKLGLFLFAALSLFSVSSVATAGTDEPTRRAFIVGIDRYRDGGIQALSRAATDAKDLGRDLEKIGFDKKNITVVTDVGTKAEFNKKFDAFLETVKEGDFVFFFFSGHGLGIEATNTNYLFFGNLKSPFSYTREQLPVANRKDTNIVKLQVGSFLDAYERDEVPKDGVSAREIEEKLAERKPKTAVVILDACRSILASEPGDARKIKRGTTSGSRLVPDRELPEGFIVLYSASFGEQAVESFGPNDRRRNSLFTEVLRTELFRPGQSLVALAERMRLVVRAVALGGGQQQEPEYYAKDGGPDDVYLVESIGAERFALSQEMCEGAQADWEQISKLPRREQLERHIRRFDQCATAELARRTLVNFSESSEESSTTRPSVASTRPIDPCDRLAASDADRARPPEVPGVAAENLVADEAVAACQDSVAKNPRVVRFLFNLGRAQMALANRYRVDDPARKEAYRLARLALEDAAQRGYVAALNNLALLYDSGLGVEQSTERANDLLKRAAQQGFPLAMYNLALRYKSGDRGIQRDLVQAYEWFAKAAESGFVPAMVEVGDSLWFGRGVARNPRRAIEWLQQASEAGSNRAKLLLGRDYFFGHVSFGQNGEVTSNSVVRDYALALLWFGRAAETGDPEAQHSLALIMDNGWGLPNPQPEIAERYWRLAAYGGNEDAEVEFADKLRLGRVLAKPENGAEEGLKLLQRAFSQRSARAALQLAKIYRSGEFDQPNDPILAMKYAYQAIEFSTEADPGTDDGNPYHEVAAGILLAEMARSGEAVGADGRQLLNKDEIDRLERFYGKVDPMTKQVKVRRLWVQLDCGAFSNWQSIWVWDWGRDESPTEPQIRSLERKTHCQNNKDLRDTLAASFALSRKNDVSFAELIDQQIKSAQAVEAAPAGRSRHRR